MLRLGEEVENNGLAISSSLGDTSDGERRGVMRLGLNSGETPWNWSASSDLGGLNVGDISCEVRVTSEPVLSSDKCSGVGKCGGGACVCGRVGAG